MSGNRAISLAYSQRRLNDAIQGMVKGSPKARKRVVRKIAVDVLRDTLVGITTGEGGNPKRVDTGRYRAAWRAGGEAAGVKVGAGLAPAVRVRGEGGRFVASAREGTGEWEEGPDYTALTITNNVEYAAHVEYGTASMAPGNHLTRALDLAYRNVPGRDGPIVSDTKDRWGRS